MKYSVAIMLTVAFIAWGWTWYAIGLNTQPKPETYEVVFEDDCFIEHDGKEIKVLSVKDLKL